MSLFSTCDICANYTNTHGIEARGGTCNLLLSAIVAPKRALFIKVIFVTEFQWHIKDPFSQNWRNVPQHFHCRKLTVGASTLFICWRSPSCFLFSCLCRWPARFVLKLHWPHWKRLGRWQLLMWFLSPSKLGNALLSAATNHVNTLRFFFSFCID